MSPTRIGGDEFDLGGGGGAPLGVGVLPPTLLPSPNQARKLELLTGGLGAPWRLLYGRHRLFGIPIWGPQEDANKNILLALFGGLGEWDALETLFINGTAVALPNTAIAHFHPGKDGELGVESAPGTPNQKSCSFWPADFSPQLTFSQVAYLSLKVAPNPAAPGPVPHVLWIARTRKVRVFDNTGTQTAFQYSVNPADVIADSYIQFEVKRHSKINEALTTAEKNRIDWVAYDELFDFCATNPGDGQALFEAHLAQIEFTDLKRWLDLCAISARCFIYERNGKLIMRPDQPRASVMTISRDLLAGPVTLHPRQLEDAVNEMVIEGDNLGSGGGTPAKDFQLMSKKLVDEDHQDRTGRHTPLFIDLQNTTPGRLQRIAEYLRGKLMATPQMISMRLLAEDAATAINPLELEPGDRLTGPSDVEGFAAREWKVAEITDNPDFTRDVLCDEYDESIMSQALAAEGVVAAGVVPGTGLAPITAVDGSGVQVLDSAAGIEGRSGQVGTILQHLRDVDGLLADADKVFADGATFGRVKGTALTVGEVDLSKAGVIQKVLDNITDSSTRKARTAAHSSYRPLGNYLTATDAGASATISLAAGTNRVAGVDVSVNSGSITGVGFDVLRFVRFDDAGFAGGAVTYAAETVKEDALNGTGRFFWGSIRTPLDGGVDTIGFNDGGAGAQTGGFFTFLAATRTVTTDAGTSVANPENVNDGNSATAATLSLSGPGGVSNGIINVRDFPGSTERWSSIKLKVRSQVLNTAGTPTFARARYSLNGGASFTNIYSVTADRALQTDEVALSLTQNIAQVQVEFTVAGNSVDDFMDIAAYEAWIEGVA